MFFHLHLVFHAYQFKFLPLGPLLFFLSLCLSLSPCLSHSVIICVYGIKVQ